MKTLVAAGFAALGLMASPALAAPVSAELKAEFYKTCVAISQNEPLCTCKADTAVKLIDADFMTMVIASMKGKGAPAEYNVPYNDYIAQSNAVCIPGY